MILDALPSEIREQLLWRASRVDETYPGFISHVSEAVDSILYHRGRFDKTVNLVEQNEALPELAANSEDSFEDAVCAVMKRLGFKGKGKGRGAAEGAGRPRTPGPSQAGKLKCANCGSDEHDKLKCPKPLVAVGDRACHECGQKGHISRFCPRKKVAGMVDDHDLAENECFCLEAGEWSTVPARRPHPSPARTTRILSKTPCVP